MEGINRNISIYYEGVRNMKKSEFLNALEKKLSGLPKDDIEERLEFYSESIDDRIEEGKTEEEAINDIGSVDEIANNIIKETPLTKIVKEKVGPKRKISGLEVFLLILGFPLWFPLLLVCGILMLVGYMLVWILVIVTYAVEIAVIGYASVGFYATMATLGSGFNLRYLAIGIMGLGFALLFIFACVLATKISFRLTKRILLGIKKRLIGGGKENA